MKKCMLLLTPFLLCGCATIVEGTTQQLSVTSFPEQQAQCTLTNSQGTYFVSTPGTVTVHKTKTDLIVKCQKSGFDDSAQVQPARLTAATAGNILAGGIIGIGVDAASGANYYYDSPVTVVLKPAGNQPATSTGAGM